MKSDDIRKANELCQKMAQETKDVSQHEAALESLKASMLTEVAAQLSEVAEHLKCIAHPLMEVESAEQAAGEKTLRDEFAMSALTAIITQGAMNVEMDVLPFVQDAYTIADAMLEARKK